MNGKKVWKKTGFGILFVAACFAAMYILMEFRDNQVFVLSAAVLLLVTAFLFLNEVFSDKIKQLSSEEEESFSVGNEEEFRVKISKHMREMETTQDELIEVLKNQNKLLQNQMEHMEQAIVSLSEKQANQLKSVIKFNKENARQLAISERETLEYIMLELKKAIEDNAGAVAVNVSEEAADMPVLEEISGEELFEVSDLPGDDEYIVPEIPAPEEPTIEEPAIEEPIAEEIATEEPEEEFEIPDMPEDIDLSALFEDMAAGTTEEITEIPTEENPVTEEILAIEDIPVTEEKEELAADPLAGFGGDPNAMMTPEDIAKLLASMGQ